MVSVERIPRDSAEDAKRAIISTLITHPERAAALFRDLSSFEIFGEGWWRDIVEAMYVIYNQGIKITQALIRREMEKAEKPTTGLQNAFLDAMDHDALYESDFSRHIDVLKERYLLENHQHGAELLGNRGEVIDLCEDTLAKASREVGEKESKWDEIAGEHEMVQGIIDSGEAGDDSFFGIYGLDGKAKVPNGLLVLVGGLKGGGKTQFLLHTLHHLLTKEERVPCLLFSLESTKSSISKRLICREAGINSRVYPSSVLSEIEHKKALDAISALNGIPLTIDDSPNLSTGDILSRARAWKHENSVESGVVGVDFLQLIKRRREKGETDASALQSVAYDLANGAKALELTFLVTCQLHNAAEGVPPQIDHIEGSGGIAQAADIILMLDVEARRLHQPTGLSPEKCDFYIRKNREGEGNVKSQVPQTSDLVNSKATWI